MLTDSPAAWKRVLGTLAGVFLGAVFLFAVWAKGLDPAAFADQITMEGLDFLLPAMAVAVIALALEAGLGAALLLGLRRAWVLWPTVALVIFFLFLTGRNYWLTARGLRDPSESCGCFGSLVTRTPAEAFWQDLLLLGVPALLMFLGRKRTAGGGVWKGAVAGVAALAAMLFAWKSPELPLDNLATRLKAGVEAQELCVGEGVEAACLADIVPELEEGRHWVVLANPDTTELTDAIDSLNERALAVLDGEADPLWVLSGGTGEELQAFYWQWGPVFELRETPPPLFDAMHRRLPRSFEVLNGEVVATVAGLPPWLAGSSLAEK